ncbi:dihydrolipoyllysine-residue acetyltransferase component of pyruvate dehydrogenase complex-like [Diadema setosum]|uniref:dihydrolipoyllysine-residue acetyltransferase component of pyruvate dehydrogenase complex-like n=1 Tax=Diadema setosum TaxID=31175 RepID=UPI003B3A81CC
MQRSSSIFRCLLRARSFSSSTKAWNVGTCSYRTLRLINQAERCLHSSTLSKPRLLYQLRNPCRFFSSEDLPAHFKITLPALSPTMEVGSVVRWEKQVGDKIQDGDLLCEIETDKATMGFEASEEGYLAKIFVDEGAKDVPVGRLLCIIAEEESDVAAFKDFEDLGVIEDPPSPPSPVHQETASQAAPAPPPPRPTPPPAPAAPTPPPAAPAPPSPPPPPQPPRVGAVPPASGPQGRVFASPLARKMAAERGIELGLVQGTGPGGRIVKADIEAFVPGVAVAMPGAPVAAAFTDIPVDALRMEQANAAIYSKQTIPHYYLMADIDVAAVLRLQGNLNEMVGEDNQITLNEFIIKAASLACMKIPDANSAWFGDKIRQYHNVDINIAVTSDFGTVTPVVHAANTKGLEAIRQEVNYLTAMVQDGKIQPQGGTFSISNFSEFGVRGMAGIIPSPQACHLGVGAVQERFVPDDDAEEGYRAASLVTVTLVCDHRVVDGAVGAQWLQQFKRYLEQPESMLL